MTFQLPVRRCYPLLLHCRKWFTPKSARMDDVDSLASLQTYAHMFVAQKVLKGVVLVYYRTHFWWCYFARLVLCKHLCTTRTQKWLRPNFVSLLMRVRTPSQKTFSNGRLVSTWTKIVSDCITSCNRFCSCASPVVILPSWRARVYSLAWFFLFFWKALRACWNCSLIIFCFTVNGALKIV